MIGHTDRTNSGSTTTVGDAERLVQVEVTNIGSIGARTTETHLSVEIGAIEVHLPSVGMDQITDPADARFKNSMGGWIGDHECCEPVGMFGNTGSEILLIDVAVGIASHWNHPQASHHRTGRIGAVGTCRDQAHIAVRITSGKVPGPYHQKAGVFPLGSGVGLQ